MPAVPLRHRARDLGFHLCLDAWLVDSWCTRVHFFLDEPPFPYSASEASLTVAGRDMEPLPLIRVELEEDNPLAGWMLFGPLPEGAEEALLVVSRMTVPPEGARPEVYHNPFLDPFESEGKAALAEALETRHESNRGLKYDLPPGWECSGRWAFQLPVPPRTRSGRVPAGVLIPVGVHAVHVPWLDHGESGTLVALDFIPREWLEHGAGWRAHGERQVTSAPDEVPPLPTYRVALAVGDEEPTPVRSGPFGVLGVRHYLELPPLPSGSLVARVQEAHGLPLPEPWEHGFDPHSFEEHATFGYSLEPVGLPGEGTFTLTGVYDDGTAMLVSYQIDMASERVASAWPQRVSLVGPDGMELLCQGDGVHWIGYDEPLRGLLFGSPEGIGPAMLRVGAVDVAFREPIEAALASSEVMP